MEQAAQDVRTLAEPRPAILTRLVAQRIIDRVTTGLELAVSVTDGAGFVQASTDPSLVGSRSLLAETLLAGAVLDGDELGALLAYADCTVGVLLLHNAGHHSPTLPVARTLAELIIHQLVVVDQLPHRSWARDRLLDDLLHERLTASPESVLHQAALLEVDLSQPRLVALVDLAGLPPPIPPPQASSLRAIDQRRRELDERARLAVCAANLLALHADDLCACLGERWLAILPVLGPPAFAGSLELPARLEALLDELAAHWRLDTRASIGGSYGGLAGLARSFRDARFALEVGPTIGAGERVFTVAALGLAALVCRDDPEARGALAGHLLAPLAGEPELLATLATFLRTDLSLNQAAEELHIHRHTLGYRLDKILARTGLDPRRFRDAAQLHAALLLQRAPAR